MRDVQLLQKAIRQTHRCDSLHVESVPVVERFEGKTAWQGTVEVFVLIDHPKAQLAYALMYREDDQDKTIAVLGRPHVDSPQSAVKVAIAAKEQKSETQ